MSPVENLEAVQFICPLAAPGVLGDRPMRDTVDEAQIAGRTLGLQLQFVEPRPPDEVEHAFSAMREARAGGILVFPNPMLFEARSSIAEHNCKEPLASVAGGEHWGACCPTRRMFRRCHHRAADHIRAGHQPQDRQNPRPDIPPSLVQRADQ